jgi:preprotein translocase subunit SecD
LRAAVIAGLGGVGVLVGVSRGSGQEPRPAKRAEIALVRVDDENDPLRGVDDYDIPEGVSLYKEVAPLGKNRRESRHYVRASLRDGESLEQAWARLRPWLEKVKLPAGERWAWESVSEPVATSEEGAPIAFRVAALRSFVLTGDPFVTTADVESAEVGLDKDTQQAYVLVTFGNAGTERFARVSEEWLGRRIAIMVDGRLESAPWVRTPIQNGRVSITMGSASSDAQIANAKRLAASLR